jgi:hypothetical protein
LDFLNQTFFETGEHLAKPVVDRVEAVRNHLNLGNGMEGERLGLYVHIIPANYFKVLRSNHSNKTSYLG